MKKGVLFLFFAFLFVFTLSGCSCKHEWTEASCLIPKTCSKCGEIEGEPLGHTWTDANCVTPKTCSICTEVEGEALGHSWIDATCILPKTCSLCTETEGEPLGHTWTDANCVIPKTCSVCAETEGEALGHSWQDASCAAPKTCSVCSETEGEPLKHTPEDWMVIDNRLVLYCSVCAGEIDSKELTLTSGLEMKALSLYGGLVMAVPKDWSYEEYPYDLLGHNDSTLFADQDGHYAVITTKLFLTDATIENIFDSLAQNDDDITYEMIENSFGQKYIYGEDNNLLHGHIMNEKNYCYITTMCVRYGQSQPADDLLKNVTYDILMNSFYDKTNFEQKSDEITEVGGVKLKMTTYHNSISIPYPSDWTLDTSTGDSSYSSYLYRALNQETSTLISLNCVLNHGDFDRLYQMANENTTYKNVELYTNSAGVKIIKMTAVDACFSLIFLDPAGHAYAIDIINLNETSLTEESIEYKLWNAYAEMICPLTE